MVIRKRPIISWLLNADDLENESKLGIPTLKNLEHFMYLSNGMQALFTVRNESHPDWGLPELVMPSFEEIMKKSAKHFIGIDHQLFQDFYNDNVCGILILRNAETIVYGFGENRLYVWLFRESNGFSNLYMYFYVESTQDNKRRIYTNSTLADDVQLFEGDKSEREQIYAKISDLLIIYLAVKKYAKVEEIVVPVGSVTNLDGKIYDYKSKEKIRNESGQKVIVMDSRWFRRIINDNDIYVRGFFRFQNKKDESGRWYKELIYVDSHVRHGYHRDALVDSIEKDKE